MGGLVARECEAAAEQSLVAVAARELRLGRERHIRHGLGEAGGGHDLALHPGGVGLASDGLDHQPCEGEAVVAVFQPSVGLDRRWRREVFPDARLVRERRAASPVGAVGAVPEDAGGVGQELRDRRSGDVGVQARNVLAGRVIQPQAPLLAQLHDGGGGEGLGVGGDAEAMARRQLRAGREIGVAERGVEHDLALVGDGDGAAGLIRQAHLVGEPLRDVGERRREPGGGFAHRVGPMQPRRVGVSEG